MYRIEEFSEIWVDVCLRNSEGQFMFMSIFGRDGSILQFVAAMELGDQARGISRFHLIDDQGARHPVDVGGTQRLSKHATRLPRQNVFGPLNHMWLFDKCLQTPDQVNRIAWVLHAPEGDATDEIEQETLMAKTWQTLVQLSPVALLEHWREPVIQWCLEKRAIASLDDDVYVAIGRVQAVRVSLTDHFVKFISTGVQQGLLRL
jgi:hypothetical protein